MKVALIDPGVEAEVERLPMLDLHGVREAWPPRFGPVPKLRSPDLLRRQLAWRLQVEAYGDLDAVTRKLLAKAPAPTGGPRIEVGTRLVREWRGERHEVEVLEEGVRYRGDTFASLSEAARVITGVRWNGPRLLRPAGCGVNVRAVVKPAVLRCAVYTRKSSDEGLEQDYNSLHAQRDACEAYVRSQIGEGWTLRPDAYDDGGISGGTMERPGLKRLLADIAGGLIDVVVVYKVDRLTRSLGDFARIVEQFDAQGVSFVSVTQAFNTTSSMGRLTLNVLLSFAQFEREVTGERIRDKIALSKANGMWMGSTPPLGYDPGDHTLLVNEAEAVTVRRIFARYLELGSVHALARELKEEGVRSKRWTTAKGREIGGEALTRGALFHLLRNRHYLGEVIHKTQTHPGLHPAIVDPAVFDAAQAKLVENQVVRRTGSVKAAKALFTGRVFDGEGRRFTPTFSTGRNARIHRYYVVGDVQLGREATSRKDAIRRIGADALETLVLNELRWLSGRHHAGAAELAPMLLRIELRPEDTHLVLDPDPPVRRGTTRNWRTTP